MAQTYSNENAGIDAVPPVIPSALQAFSARVRVFRATIPLTGQAVGDTIVLGDIPAGYIFHYAVLNASVTLGTATLDLTLEGSVELAPPTGLTAASSPAVVASIASDSAEALTKQTRAYATVMSEALPASGTLVIDMFWSDPN